MGEFKVPEYDPKIQIGFCYDPATKQYLSKEPTEASHAIWTPWKKKYGLVMADFDLEEMRKGWSYLRTCVLEPL